MKFKKSTWIIIAVVILAIAILGGQLGQKTSTTYFPNIDSVTAQNYAKAFASSEGRNVRVYMKTASSTGYCVDAGDECESPNCYLDGFTTISKTCSATSCASGGTRTCAVSCTNNYYKCSTGSVEKCDSGTWDLIGMCSDLGAYADTCLLTGIERSSVGAVCRAQDSYTCVDNENPYNKNLKGSLTIKKNGVIYDTVYDSCASNDASADFYCNSGSFTSAVNSYDYDAHSCNGLGCDGGKCNVAVSTCNNDGNCLSPETYTNCPTDCKCGDGFCDTLGISGQIEDIIMCPVDCANPPPPADCIIGECTSSIQAPQCLGLSVVSNCLWDSTKNKYCWNAKNDCPNGCSAGACISDCDADTWAPVAPLVRCNGVCAATCDTKGKTTETCIASDKCKTSGFCEENEDGTCGSVCAPWQKWNKNATFNESTPESSCTNDWTIILIVGAVIFAFIALRTWNRGKQ